jgi:hypothetical protein
MEGGDWGRKSSVLDEEDLSGDRNAMRWVLDPEYLLPFRTLARMKKRQAVFFSILLLHLFARSPHKNRPKQLRCKRVESRSPGKCTAGHWEM